MKIIFVNQINSIIPKSPQCPKIPLSNFQKLVFHRRHPASSQRGVRAIVTIREVGMRWPCRCCSAHSRVDEHIDADGEVVWSWPPGAEVKVAMLLDEHCKRRGQQSRSPGRSRINRKPIAQGRPDVRPCLWFCRVLFVARGPWVRPAPGLPCALCYFEGQSQGITRATRAARMRSCGLLFEKLIRRSDGSKFVGWAKRPPRGGCVPTIYQ
jgi:hypothetical protein